LTTEPGIFWVSILENAAGKLYVGSSDDPHRRETEHNDATCGRVTFTHKHGPWKLIWREAHPSRGAALTREWACGFRRRTRSS
jgi:predicted GIY-YIG superfamily endonuclease